MESRVVDIPVVATGGATCHVSSMMVDGGGVLASTTPGVPISCNECLAALRGGENVRCVYEEREINRIVK